jgi:predicted nucleotidyltransferase
MKSIDEIKEIIDIHKDALRKEYGLKEIGVFGSYVRGAQRADSDLDILIEFEKPVGFVKFLRLENRLSDLLGVKVEMVTKKALKPFIGKRILQEVIYV